MKTKGKILILTILILGVMATVGLWLYSSEKPIDLWGYTMLGLITIVVGLSMYFALNFAKSEKAGLPAEDELSKRIKEKAAAKAFSFSIYMWAFGAMFLVDTGVRADLVIGFGIMGMGLVFLVTWFYLSKVGISDNE